MAMIEEGKIRRFKIGQRVVSPPLGRCGQFEGTIVDVVGCHFVVEDDRGRRWLRERTELQFPDVETRQ